jgi:hypothetical protein
LTSVQRKAYEAAYSPAMETSIAHHIEDCAALASISRTNTLY